MRFPLPSFEFYQRLSPRERTLSLIVGGALLLVANIVAISTLLRSSRELRTQIADKSQVLHTQTLYAQEQPMWKQRVDWLKAKEPALLNRDRAGTDLLGEVQGAARVNRVVLTSFQITPPASAAAGERVTTTDYQPVSVSIETQSDWFSLVQFVAALQRPEGFLVFEKATLRSDANDPQRMKGAFSVSKWYAASVK